MRFKWLLFLVFPILFLGCETVDFGLNDAYDSPNGRYQSADVTGGQFKIKLKEIIPSEEDEAPEYEENDY